MPSMGSNTSRNTSTDRRPARQAAADKGRWGRFAALAAAEKFAPWPRGALTGDDRGHHQRDGTDDCSTEPAVLAGFRSMTGDAVMSECERHTSSSTRCLLNMTTPASRFYSGVVNR